MIKNVVNLIPPPVEALPAPINIRSIINSREGFDKAEISTVLNPQCELKLPEISSHSLFKGVNPLIERELWNSNIKIKTVAIILTIRVEESISFECNVRF